jgi:hypothetical protein
MPIGSGNVKKNESSDKEPLKRDLYNSGEYLKKIRIDKLSITPP